MGVLSRNVLGKKNTPLTRPWSVQIGMVEGCNRLCTFCGLNAIRTKVGENIKCMEIATAHKIAKDLAKLCPTARVEFAMHGEPTLHPQWQEILSIFRQHLPQCQLLLTTNGRTWMRSFDISVAEAFNAGVNIIILDTYNPERTKLHKLARACSVPNVEVVDYYDELLPQGKEMLPWTNHRGKIDRLLVITDDIEVRNGSGARDLLNHAGNSADQPIPDEPLNLTCERPFREITVCHDGDVNICCMDWGHEYNCGNVKEKSLDKIWRGERFTSARRVLKRNERGFSPCDRCNYIPGSRLNLLPDLGRPTVRDLRILTEAKNQWHQSSKVKKLWPTLIKMCGGKVE